MKKFDLRTPIIYVLTFIILILLIVMKKMDDEKKEKVLEEKMTRIKEKYDKYKNNILNGRCKHESMLQVQTSKRLLRVKEL